MAFSKEKLIKIIILIIGLTTPFLFIINSPLSFYTRKIPVSPLPLVFDEQLGSNTWVNNYIITFHYQNKNKTMNFIETGVSERRGWARHILCHTILFLNAPIKTEATRKLEKNFYCLILGPALFKGEDKILKTTLLTIDTSTKAEISREIICD